MGQTGCQIYYQGWLSSVPLEIKVVETHSGCGSHNRSRRFHENCPGWTYWMPYETVGDMRMYYETAGSSALPAIVLLHGFGGIVQTGRVGVSSKSGHDPSAPFG